MKKMTRSWIARQVAKWLAYGLTFVGGAELAQEQEVNVAAASSLLAAVAVIGVEALWSWWQNRKTKGDVELASRLRADEAAMAGDTDLSRGWGD